MDIKTDYYAIDLETKALSIQAYDAEHLAEDIKFFGVKHAEDLDSPDWKVFNSLKSAENWRAKYIATMKQLNGKTFKKTESYPCMLYKRRYLAQALLGEKIKTCRHYKKDWKVGQKFYFNDQKNFVLVKLTSLKKTKQGNYDYEYELLK